MRRYAALADLSPIRHAPVRHRGIRTTRPDQKAAHVESSCPVTGETIRLTVSPSEVESFEPVSTVVSFLIPEAAKAKENIVTNFCHYVHFFSSREAGARWTSAHEGTFLLTVEEAFDLGHRMNQARYRHTLYTEDVPQQ